MSCWLSYFLLHRHQKNCSLYGIRMYDISNVIAPLPVHTFNYFLTGTIWQASKLPASQSVSANR